MNSKVTNFFGSFCSLIMELFTSRSLHHRSLLSCIIDPPSSFHICYSKFHPNTVPFVSFKPIFLKRFQSEIQGNDSNQNLRPTSMQVTNEQHQRRVIANPKIRNRNPKRNRNPTKFSVCSSDFPKISPQIRYVIIKDL